VRENIVILRIHRLCFGLNGC